MDKQYRMRLSTTVQSITFFVFLVFLQFILSVLCFDDFVDCGGFIRPSKKLLGIIEDKSLKIDFSKDVKVHLLTLDGNKKFTADCAPNGYYIIPVYDKGNFRLSIEGPDGWIFEPVEVPINLQTEEGGGCNYDFELTGFSIKGKVTGDGNCKSNQLSAPKGITLKLSSSSSQKQQQPVQIVKSADDGSFSFSNTVPGQYVVEASHEEWEILNPTVEIVQSWGNFVIKENFVVKGYGISGRVLETSENGEPVQSVSFFLYPSLVDTSPSTSTQPLTINCPEITDVTPNFKTKPLCAVKTDTQGRFSFSSIPCGAYTLVPFYTTTTSSHTTYDVIPKEYHLLVDQESISITKPFLVKGFSVRGQVVGPNSEGIEGVIVKATPTSSTGGVADGVRTAITDATGGYVLDQITSGEYGITAEKIHHVFSSVSKYKISPSTSELTDIVASRFHVCGRVSIPLPPPGVVEKRKVTLQPTDKSTPPLTTKTDQTGAYCIAALPGRYTISPEILPSEIEAGLLLTETSFDITVENVPVLDINFEQARLTVSGRVRCIESPCDTSISVSLTGSKRASQVTGLAFGHDDSGEDHFIFKGVLPGKYEVTINHENWCWKKETEIVEVTTRRDQNDIQFVQTGFVLVVKSSHAIDLLSLHLDDGEENTYKLEKGKNSFCLPKPGTYTFTPKSCYRFDADNYTYDTTKPLPLKLNAMHYLIQCTIYTPMEAKIGINVTNGERVDTIMAVSVKEGVQEFVYWAELGQKLRFTPFSIKGEKEEEETLFFYPQYQEASVEKSECPPPLPPFHARPGMYLSGLITPPFEGVSISIYYKGTQTLALSQITSDANGRYRAGPLYDDREYEVSASKPGFCLKAKGSGDFLAQKLGSVDIRVTHQGNPLPGVLLSLSGSEGYRNNNPTDNQGAYQFTNLFPGEYYLRPIFKEYTFTPSAQAVEIKEGEELKVHLLAKRVAYSVYGKVTTLNGQPEKFVSVEAVGVTDEGLYEETQTDHYGTYRLRGLLPNKDYILRVKLNSKSASVSDGSHKLSRAEPSQVQVTVTDCDIENVDFIVFRKNPKYEVAGVVNPQAEESEKRTALLATLTIQLYSLTSSASGSFEEKLVSEQPLVPCNYFNFNGLDGETEYLLKLKTELSERQYTIKSSEYKIPVLSSISSVDKATYSKLELTFEAEEKKIETLVENGSFGSLLFTAFIAFCIYNYKFIYDRYKQYTSNNQNKMADNNDYLADTERRGKLKKK